jgi:peptidyl-prolyl cis-trans isomerase A (cyclophilin A)
MRKIKWVLIAAGVGMLSFGCKKEEPVSETKPVEQPKTAAPVEVKPEAKPETKPEAKPETPPATQPTPAPAAAAGAPAPAPPRPGFDRALLRPAMLKEKAPDTFQVKFETTRGDFTVTVTRAWAPLGADRFYNLVKHHFYDNASFFRVVPGFVVQFGISAYPPVSAAWANANINDEPVVGSNKRGYLTYAKTSMPNTRSTQVFINLKDNPGLDRQGFSPFGVVEGNGMNVVEMLYDQYGDNGPDQEQLTKLGKPYLDKNFAKLDSIKTATLVGAGGAAPK